MAAFRMKYEETDYEWFDFEEKEREEKEELKNCFDNLCKLLKCDSSSYKELDSFLKLISVEMLAGFIPKLFNMKVKSYYAYSCPNMKPIFLTIVNSDFNKFNVLVKYGHKVEFERFILSSIYNDSSLAYIINVFETYEKKIRECRDKSIKKIDYSQLIWHTRYKARKDVLLYIFKEKGIFINEKYSSNKTLIYPDSLGDELKSTIIQSTPNNELTPDTINIISSYITG